MLILPTILEPLDGAAVTTPATLKIRKNTPLQKTYLFQVALDAAFAAVAWSATHTNNALWNEIAIAAPLSIGTYWFRVGVLDGAVYVYVGPNAFEVVAPPRATDLRIVGERVN